MPDGQENRDPTTEENREEEDELDDEYAEFERGIRELEASNESLRADVDRLTGELEQLRAGGSGPEPAQPEPVVTVIEPEPEPEPDCWLFKRVWGK